MLLLNSLYRLKGNPFFLRTNVSFLIIGAQRCGTTSLYEALIHSPQIGAAYKKELHFFDVEWTKGIDFYRRSFQVRPFDSRVFGEASPYYLFHPAVPARVASCYPRMKLICLLRDPVERAFSHYRHVRKHGWETLPLEEAFARESERLEGEEEKILKDDSYYSASHQHHSYVSRGRYADQIKRWFQYFPREQFCFLRSETLFAEPSKQLARVADFLKIDPTMLGPLQQTNGVPATEDHPELRLDLTNLFEEPNRVLQQLLGSEFCWSNGNIPGLRGDPRPFIGAHLADALGES
jgi:hypothetical protein